MGYLCFCIPYGFGVYSPVTPAEWGIILPTPVKGVTGLRPMRDHGPLTATKIDRLTAKEERYAVRDGGCPGLQLRVTPKGEKSFRWQYRAANGKGAWVTIGKWTM